jgi:hypothetical protein
MKYSGACHYDDHIDHFAKSNEIEFAACFPVRYAPWVRDFSFGWVCSPTIHNLSSIGSLKTFMISLPTPTGNDA